MRASRPNPRDERLELNAERLIAAHGLIPRESPLVVGVSGGPDSIALLDFLAGYRERSGIPAGGLIAGHVNHGLRGDESEGDAAFVERAAERLGIRCLTARVAPGLRQRERRESREAAARALRYEALRKMAAEAGTDRVAVAHTADDQAETVLLRLIRGAGLTGLSGMRPIRAIHGLTLIRPLLTTTREQVLDYLERRGLEHRLDSSNFLPDARRNFLRLEILPRIRELMNPSILQSLLRGAALFREADDYLSAEARRALPGIIRARGPGKIELDAAGMLHYPELLRKYLFRYVLQELNGDILDLSTAHIDALHSLLTSHAGRSADIPMGIQARRERGTVVLRKREAEPERAEAPSKA
ncbi:MAG: tRNA lysidine(34) synthetase TilS [Candidatus Eisenbacteria bacterium]|uniref:tRNA(Ile)-lysidine synthase n=1 Tax=Eiseniibacteriota bacterium TaxID=2212470 RepID=A0A538T3D4_UNCEI|nr:MAG: tRNA lysidine(34) synthetase TilS [Candidatus Eisenbacteria bacterium]